MTDKYFAITYSLWAFICVAVFLYSRQIVGIFFGPSEITRIQVGMIRAFAMLNIFGVFALLMAE